MTQPTRWIVGTMVAVTILAIAIGVVLFLGGGADLSNADDMLDRLEAGGIDGCRTEDERTVACYDVAGVAYFRGIVDDEMATDDPIATICDPSTVVALFSEGQEWFGRVRAHPQRASDLAAALETEATRCPGAAV
jgi:hypothetical protein